jgi:hypothetical protein
VPVAAALSGRPAPPKAVHRSALPGVIVFAVGLACLVLADGLAGVDGGSPGHAPFLLAGLAAVVVGIILLAPLAISVLAAGATRRAAPGPASATETGPVVAAVLPAR